MKQTAVEWLYEILHERNYIYEEMIEYLNQAKEMEKEQIITAYNKAVPFKFGKEYYNETFKN